jgi:hypothetical protein
MSDEAALPATAREARSPRPAGIYNHFCEETGCAKWGGWGFGRGKEPTIWFCYEHAPLVRL